VIRVSDQCGTAAQEMVGDQLGESDWPNPNRVAELNAVDTAALAQQDSHLLETGFRSLEIEYQNVPLVREVVGRILG
jgi:hypothetical protein